MRDLTPAPQIGDRRDLTPNPSTTALTLFGPRVAYSIHAGLPEEHSMYRAHHEKSPALRGFQGRARSLIRQRDGGGRCPARPVPNRPTLASRVRERQSPKFALQAQNRPNRCPAGTVRHSPG